MLVDNCPEDIADLRRLAAQDAGIASLVVIENGWSALDYLYGREPFVEVPHVILLSMDAPNVQGVEFVGDLRWEREYNAIPVVLLCQPAAPDVDLKSRAFGVLGCTRKPVSAATMSWISESARHYWKGIEMLGRLQNVA